MPLQLHETVYACILEKPAGKQEVKRDKLQQTKKSKQVANRSHCSQELSSCQTSKLFQNKMLPQLVQ